MREFTLTSFKTILETFRQHGYVFVRFEDFLMKSETKKLVILRHDVDRFPGNALKMAELESVMGIRSTYFFRIIPSVYKPVIMKAIAGMGHEVAYHYEDLTLAGGDREKALELFSRHLDMIREIYPAKTICMHGSPLSRWDNKDMWIDAASHKPQATGKPAHTLPSYHEYGIIGDTSFDVNYDEVFYITDNGWGWNKTSSSVRDKVDSRFDIPIDDTDDFLEQIGHGSLPAKILFNTHPDSFFEPYFPWLMNKLFIKSKNIVKRQIVKYKIFK